MKNSKKYIGAVNVFGTLYKVFLFDYECEYIGLTDKKEKRIYIDCRLKDEILTDTLTHELLHAYFYECGLESYSNDETLVGCLGRWFLSINNNVACLEYCIKKSGVKK